MTTTLKVLVTALCLLAANGPIAADDVDQAMSTIRPEAIRAHMTFLADDLLEGRDTGSKGYEIAARYVASRLMELGVQPGGPNGSWYQQVPFRKAVPMESMVVLLNGDATQTLEWKKDYLVSGSVLETLTEIEAPILYVGFGVTAPEFDYDDYEGVDARGKIVAMLRNAPSSFPSNARAHYASSSNKARTAAERGAIGIISLQTPEQENGHPFEKSTRFANYPSLEWLDSHGDPQGVQPSIRVGLRLSPHATEMLFSESPVALEAIWKAAAANEPRPVELPTRIRVRSASSREEIQSPNVVGTIPGSDLVLENEFIVFVAHLDHVGTGEPENGDGIHNGAYDNASGIAVLIEVARAFRSLPAPPKRSIVLLAVTGEEKGLLGADYFANHPSVDGEIVAAFSIDMFLMLYPLHDVVAFGADSSSLGESMRAAASRLGVKLSPDFAPEEVLFVRTDHYPFVKKGIPALFLVHGLESGDPQVNGGLLMRNWLTEYYHSPKDQMDQEMDFGAGAAFARLNFLLGLEVANADERPKWNEGDFFGAKFAH